MAMRKGVAILREIAMVKTADIDQATRIAMLRELNDELAELYKPRADAQQKLPLEVPAVAQEVRAKK